MAGNAENVYARSLFELAEETDGLDRIADELDAVAALLAENPDYIRLLSSPAISKEEKVALVSQAFDAQVSPELSGFLKVLAHNGRMAAFEGIYAAFRALCDEARGILAVTAVTAVEMSAPLQEKLREKLAKETGKTIALCCKVDPAVLGGVLLRYDNKEIDGTVRERLATLRRELAGRMV